MSALSTTPLLPTSALRRRGMGRADVEKAVEEGRLWRVHRGWYALPGTDAELIRAMRLGGRLGCVSALRLYGAWTPPDTGMHIAMPRSASGRRLDRADSADPPVVHWHSKQAPLEWTEGMSPLDLAIAHCVECQPRDMTIAVLDSLLHRRVVGDVFLAKIRDRLPSARQELFAHLDERSEEGIESLARVRLREAGLQVEPQFVVPDVGRVDLLVEGRLVVELDGRAIHAQQEAFTRDRKRTALLAQHGYPALHFSYAHVIYDWALVLDSVLARLRHI